MIDKHFNSVRQDLWQGQVADVAAQGHDRILIISVLLELSEGLQALHEALALLIYVIKLVSQQEKVPEELYSELGVTLSEFTVLSKHAVELEVDRIPTGACLIKRMHHREAVERVALQVLLAHPLVGLPSEGHVVAELSELLKHQVVVSCLLKAHRPEDRFVSKPVCKAHEKVSRMVVFAEGLKQLCHH